MSGTMSVPNTTDARRDSPRRERLHVVFVDHVARLSGGEIALIRLVPTLARHVDVTVILGEHGPLVRKLTVRPTGLDFKALRELPPYVRTLRRRIRELDAAIVHTNSLKSALYGG